MRRGAIDDERGAGRGSEVAGGNDLSDLVEAIAAAYELIVPNVEDLEDA
ncbi:hypothetical protein [Salinarimonas chemoclinalis]